MYIDTQRIYEMENLPDELWRRILEIGTKKSPVNSLSYKDLCCVSILSRRFNRLSSEDSLWAHLLSTDFPQFDLNFNKNYNLSSSSSLSSNKNPISCKTQYRIRFERDKARKLAAHQRAVLRVESQIYQHFRKLEEITLQKREEMDRMMANVLELSNLRKARQASAALNVWQPEIVRGRHKEIVEQCPVPADTRIHALEMEVKLCKQQITAFEKAYRDEKRRHKAAEEKLASMKYHPLRVDDLINYQVSKCGIKRKKMGKEHTNDKTN